MEGGEPKNMPEDFFFISNGKTTGWGTGTVLPTVVEGGQFRFPTLYYFDIVVIKTHGGKIISVDESTIDTNLLYATLDGNVITSLKFMERLEKVCIYTVSDLKFTNFKRLNRNDTKTK